MRWVIAAAAFCVPMLVVIAIGALTARSGAAVPSMPGAELTELRRFCGAQETLLTRYALPRGSAPSDVVPHLVLERFARRGVDPHGQAWYQLFAPPEAPPRGILRRIEGCPGPLVADGAVPTMVLPLTPIWSYWEVVPQPARAVESP
jgi:hypothetical protein